LRKSLIAALTALTALALAAVAIAQNPAPVVTVTGTVSPTKAGTKAKPKPESLKLVIKNSEASKSSAGRIQIAVPKTLKLDTTGLKSCSVATLDANGPDACAKAKAGSGTAVANLNPNQPSKLYFRSTPYVAGKNKLAFYLQQTNTEGGSVNPDGVAQALPASVKKTSKGQTVTIDIPKNLQQPAPGTFSALLSITSTLSLKQGSHSLLTSIGCNKKAHKVGVTITYVDNPTPPAKRSVTGRDSAKCSGKAL
jgi:hypothetical protein